jgi:hypothetical protein
MNNDILNELLLRGQDDWIQACELVSVILESMKGPPEQSLQAQTLAVLTEVLEEDLFEIGFVTEQGFKPWGTGTVDAIRRVQSEWKALGRDPGLGDLFWLNLRPKGETLARQVRTP